MHRTDSLTSARQVIESLQQLRADSPGLPDDCLGRADAIVAPVQALLTRLTRHFIEVPYPTPEYALEAMRLATALCVEAIRTFHHLLLARSQLSWLNQQLHKGHWPALVQRVFYYGYQLAFVRRIAGQSALTPAGPLLMDVLREAQAHHWLDTQLPGELAGGHGTFPPRHILHRMGLIAIAPLDEVRVDQIEEIHRLVLEWADAAKISICDGSEARAAADGEVLLIEMGERGAGNDEERPPCIAVDLRILGERLFQTLAAAVQGEAPRVRLGKGLEIGVPTLELLRDFWRLPEPQSKHFLDSDAEMAAWVQALPLANPKECTRLIYLELDGLRRRRAPIERKFAFMEALLWPIQVVLNHLRQRIGEPEFPLPEQVQRLGNLCYEICTLAMDGYEEVMMREESTGWLVAKAALDRRVIAAHRILYYGYRAVFNRKTLQLGMAEHFWATVHQAFKLAVEKDRFGQTVAAAGLDDYGDRSFVLFYKMIILAALLPMHQLRSGQLREVAGTLEEWAKEAELAFCTPDSHPEGAVVRLRPDEDAGPRIEPGDCTQCARGYCLLLSSSILIARLSRMVRESEWEAGREDVRGVKISLDTLEFLLQAWGERKGRSEDRQVMNAHLEALFSVSGIHHFLSDEAGGAAAEEVEAEEAEASTLNVENEFLLHERKADVWDYIYDWQEVNEPTWAEQTGVGPAAFVRVRILDKSKHGCRLSFLPSAGTVIRIGDLVAMRKGVGAPLYVGYVRWASNVADGGVELGIKFLMSQAVACSAMVETDERKSKRLPCLIGRYISRSRPVMVVPFIPDIQHKHVLIEEGGEFVTVGLISPPLDRSRSFEAYEWRRSSRGKGPQDVGDKPKRPAWEYL